jgi:DNA ligase-1
MYHQNQSGENMKPMLAAATDGTGLTYPLLVSPKLDGIRCLIVNGIAVSRSLKPIPNHHVQRCLSKPHLNGLDGELIVGIPTARDVFQRTTSGVMSQDGKPNFVFCVFDSFLGDHRFKERLSLAREMSKYVDDIGLVRHQLINNEEELLAVEQKWLTEGYEGVMLRDPSGPYKYGRSTLKEGWLLKLKRFADSEAVVLAVNQLMHNTNEATTDKLGHTERSSHKAGKVPALAVGSLLVRDIKTGVDFELGTGFTEDQRYALWKKRGELVSRVVKYKYQPVGVKDKPRFPVFLGFRDKRDL